MSPVAPPTSTQMLARLLGGGKASTRVGTIALAILLGSIAILVITVWPLVRLRTQVVKPVAAARSDDKALHEFEESIDRDLAQIEGRSLFAIPPKPAPPSETAHRDSAKPTRYGGPSVIAMINDKVWFSDGQRLGPGDEGKGTLKVLSLDAPWSAKVEWEGGEFDVEFFTRSPLLSSAGAGSTEQAPRLTPAPRRRGNPNRASRATAPAPTPSAQGSSATPPPPSAQAPGATPPAAEPEPGSEEPPPPPMPPNEPGREPAPPPPAPKPAPGADPASNPDPSHPPAPAPSPDPEASRP